MIIDALGNLHLYQSILPFSQEILRYIKTTNISALDIGEYQIIGKSAFLLIQEYQTKTESDKEWESHKKYIDFQIVLSGEEYIEYSNIHLLKAKDLYDEEKDIIFYENDLKEHIKLLIPQNHFCIFFPEDAHKPGLHILKEQKIKKAVIKVLK